MTNIRHTRSTPRGYTRPRVVCFDCDETTGAPVLVYRLTSYGSRLATFVHRAGSGCHKGETPDQVREVR